MRLRPRGPQGFNYQDIPWPSDVTVADVSRWAEQYIGAHPTDFDIEDDEDMKRAVKSLSEAFPAPVKTPKKKDWVGMIVNTVMFIALLSLPVFVTFQIVKYFQPAAISHVEDYVCVEWRTSLYCVERIK